MQVEAAVQADERAQAEARAEAATEGGAVGVEEPREAKAAREKDERVEAGVENHAGVHGLETERGSPGAPNEDTEAAPNTEVHQNSETSRDTEIKKMHTEEVIHGIKKANTEKKRNKKNLVFKKFRHRTFSIRSTQHDSPTINIISTFRDQYPVCLLSVEFLCLFFVVLLTV